MRGFGTVIFFAFVSALAAFPANASKRVALVMGNASYEHVARLSNPANDADAITSVLKGAGFDTIESRRNLKLPEMRKVLRDFSDKARDADVAVVYFAGHGIEVEGTNYLIPTDAVLERDADIFDEAMALDRVLMAIEPAKQLRLVILDACRDNPFAKTMKRTIGTRAVTRGLAKVEPASPNTLIAFASKAGSTAADGDSNNSPFTSALVRHITTPGLDLRRAFGYVRDDVLRSTSNRQEPFVYGSLGGDDVPLVAARPVPPSQPATDPMASVRKDYELALQVGTKDVWSEFLTHYPTGLYAGLAKGQLAKIAAEEKRIETTEKARLANEERERLAAEGARKSEQARAEERARVAEEARIEAESRKNVEQAKAAAAEAQRVAAEKTAADKLAAEKIAADQAIGDAAARKSAESPAEQKVAALSQPADAAAAVPIPTQSEIARALQSELRRVGCHTGKIDDGWNMAARRSLEKFNQRAGLKLETKLASLDAIEVIKIRPSRVCPLDCERGFRAQGEQCVKLICASGSFINDNNACEKSKPPAARKKDRPETGAAEAAKPKPQQATGQIYCNDRGCRPLRPGCRIELKQYMAGGTTKPQEVCN